MAENLSLARLPVLGFWLALSITITPATADVLDQARARCETDTSLTHIDTEALKSDSYLLPYEEVNSPIEELLERRLRLLEVAPLEKIKDGTVSEVTQYFIADIESSDCKEYRESTEKYPFTLIPRRHLGLNEKLCVAKKTAPQPQSKLYLTIDRTSTKLVFQNSQELTVSIKNRADHTTISHVKSFRICKDTLCYKGFACAKSSELKTLWAAIKGDGDPRLGHPLTVRAVDQPKFESVTAPRMFLVRQELIPRDQIWPRAFTRNSYTHPSGSIYLTEAYTTDKDNRTINQSGFFLDVVKSEEVLRTLVKLDNLNINDPRLLEVSDDEIMFAALPLSNAPPFILPGTLSERFLIFSKDLRPLISAAPAYEDFDIPEDSKIYVERLWHEAGLFRLQAIKYPKKLTDAPITRYYFEERR